MSAVVGLIDFQEARRLFTIKKADGWIYIVTFLVTLLLGMDKGLVAGIVFSLALFIRRSARPHLAVLGRVGEHEFRDLRRYPDATVDPDVILLRIDSSLYFANAGFVEEQIRTRLVQQPSVRWVVLDMSGVNDIDGVAVSMLTDLMIDTKLQAHSCSRDEGSGAGHRRTPAGRGCLTGCTKCVIPSLGLTGNGKAAPTEH